MAKTSLAQKVSLFQTNFTAGELSPRLAGRTDINKYYNGVKTLENMIPQPHGGAIRRGGTQYLGNTKSAGEKARLVSFEFSVTQAYVLEFGNNYIRVWRNQGQVLAVFSITGATQANPVVITSVDHSLVNGQKALIENVGGMTEINDTIFTVANVTADTFELSGVDGTGYTAYTSGGTATLVQGGMFATDYSEEFPTSTTAGALEIATTYTTAELFELQFAQTADTLVIVHKDHAPATLTRTSHTAWALADISFTSQPAEWGAADYPQVVAFFEQRLWMGANPDNPQTLWGSKSADFYDFTQGPLDDDSIEYTIATDQVNVIRWLSAGKVLTVGTVGGEFIVSGTTLDAAVTVNNVRIVRQSTHGSAFIQPRRISDKIMFVQRAGRKVREISFKFETDGFIAADSTILSEHITQGGLGDIAFQEEPDAVLWFVRNDGQLVGMTRQVDQDVTAWHRQILGGTSDVGGTPAIVESVTTIPTTGTTGRDETWLSVKRLIEGTAVRHVELIRGGLESDEPVQDAFFVDSGLSLDSPITITSATQADPVVVTAAGHGFSNGDEVLIDEVEGMTELNGRKFLVSNKATNTFELQSLAGVDIDGTGYEAYTQNGEVRETVTTLNGLDHLEGETVSVLVDGAVHPDVVVDAGKITLTFSGARIHVGLSYNSLIETLRFEGGSADGTSQGKIKKIKEITARFDRTVGAQAGPDTDNLDIIPFRSPAMAMDEAVALFTGDKELKFPKGYETDARVVIKQSQPLPMNVLGIMVRMRTNN